MDYATRVVLEAFMDVLIHFDTIMSHCYDALFCHDSDSSRLHVPSSVDSQAASTLHYELSFEMIF